MKAHVERPLKIRSARGKKNFRVEHQSNIHGFGNRRLILEPWPHHHAHAALVRAKRLGGISQINRIEGRLAAKSVSVKLGQCASDCIRPTAPGRSTRVEKPPGQRGEHPRLLSRYRGQVMHSPQNAKIDPPGMDADDAPPRAVHGARLETQHRMLPERIAADEQDRPGACKTRQRTVPARRAEPGALDLGLAHVPRVYSTVEIGASKH